jgi:hypothetical protein
MEVMLKGNRNNNPLNRAVKYFGKVKSDILTAKPLSLASWLVTAVS